VTMAVVRRCCPQEMGGRSQLVCFFLQVFFCLEAFFSICLSVNSRKHQRFATSVCTVSHHSSRNVANCARLGPWGRMHARPNQQGRSLSFLLQARQGDARAPQSFFCLRAERLEGNRVIYRHTTPTEPNNQPTGSTQPSSACPRPTQPSSPSGPHPPT
jgi:hypothetical protein